jgi:hypothetical protein
MSIIFNQFKMNNNKKRLALLALLRLRKKRKLNKQPSIRRYWVHPMLEVRYVEGAFYHFIHFTTILSVMCETHHLFVLVIEIGTIKISSDIGRLSDMHTGIVTLKRYFYRIGVNVKTFYL